MIKVKGQKIKANNQETVILRGQLARALADYDNLTKRVEREKSELGKIVSLGLLLRLLSVLDTLESAQAHLKDQGLAIAIGEFKKILNEEGLVEITPQKGEKFDHDSQEVVESVVGEKDGEISEIILSGWKYSDGTVIRHAKVKATKSS